MAEGSERPRRGARIERIAFGVAIVVLLVIGILSMPDSAPPPLYDDPVPATATAPAPDAASERVEQTSTSLANPLPPRGRLLLDSTRLADGRPLTIHLGLPEPSRDGEPRPVRLVSQPDHRTLELDGRLSSDRSSAAVEVDAAYLTPGAYLVEVRTTDRSHFPLGRYGIVVSE